MNTAADIKTERRKLIAVAMELIERRGKLVSNADLAAETQSSRARIDAIIEDWFAPDVAIMEEVVASDLPIQRKFYEFFARRFRREQQRLRDDPDTFALYLELGEARMEDVRGYIDLADHYMSELVAQAQAEGHFAGLTIDAAMSLINQMVICYTSPRVLMMLGDRLTEEKLAGIIDTIFAGLSGEDRGARGVSELRLA